jgi:hypothetical protein
MKKDRSYSMRLKFTLHYELLEQVNKLGLKNILGYLVFLHQQHIKHKAKYTSKYDEMAVLELRTCRQRIEDCYMLLCYIKLTKGVDIFPDAIEKYEELRNQMKKIYDRQSAPCEKCQVINHL